MHAHPHVRKRSCPVLHQQVENILTSNSDTRAPPTAISAPPTLRVNPSLSERTSTLLEGTQPVFTEGHKMCVWPLIEIPVGQMKRNIV